VFLCRPCSRCSGPVDRSVGYPTTGLCVWDAAAEAGGWAPYCVLGAAVERRGCVGIVRGAGRRDFVACGVAQCAHLGAFRLVFTFLYFRCSLDVFLFVTSLCLCAAVYGVIKNNNNLCWWAKKIIIIIVLFLN